MKERTMIRIIAVIVLLVMMSCQTKQIITIAGDQDVFVKSKDCLTNGSLVYRHLPENWYYSGDYTYQIGKVKGGNALLSTDAVGTIVKEKKPLLADMDYAPWILETAQLPDLYGDDINVVVSIQNQGKFVLSEHAHQEFITWFQKYQDGMISKTNGISLKDKPYIAVRFACVSVAGLLYDCDLTIKTNANAVFVLDNNGAIIGTFDETTQVYREVTEALLS